MAFIYLSALFYTFWKSRLASSTSFFDVKKLIFISLVYIYSQFSIFWNNLQIFTNHENIQH